MTRPIPLGLLALFAVCIGLYPLIYFLVDMTTNGLLASKPDYLLEDLYYSGAFYIHILAGGISLLVGWPQFFPKVRRSYIKAHRMLGKVYLLAALLGGVAGLAISFFATGGMISSTGFALLAILWLFTSGKAYLHIRRKEIEQHQVWMIRSFALCFAAVTLRLWLPLLTSALDISFVPAYRIIAWLCWVPNLIFAEWLIRARIAPTSK